MDLVYGKRLKSPWHDLLLPPKGHTAHLLARKIELCTRKRCLKRMFLFHALKKMSLSTSLEGWFILAKQK